MKQRNPFVQYFIKLILLFLCAFPAFSNAETKSEREKSYLELLVHTEDRKAKVDILLKLSVLFYDYDAKKNLMYADSALSISERIGYHSAIGNVYMIKADTYSRLGYINMANEYCMKALQVFESPQDDTFISGIYTLLGNINLSRSNPTEAQKYYQLAYELNTKTNHIRGAIQALLNLGIIHLGNEEYETAKMVFEKAIKLSDELNYLNGKAIGYQNLASAYSSMHKIDSSDIYYRIAQELFIQDGDKGGYSASFLGLSENAIKLNNYKLAVQYAKSAYDSIINYGNTFIAIDAAKMLISYYEHLGDSSSTLKYYKAIAEHAQEVLSAERTNNIDFIEIIQKENENQSLIKERDIQKIVNIALLLCSFLLLGIIVLLYLNRKRDKKYKEQLMLNAKELEQLNNEVEEKNQGLMHLLNVKDKLISLMAHDVRTPLNNVKSIIYLLREDSLSQEKFNTYLFELEQQTNTTSEMIDNLLNWAKIQMNGINLKPVKLSLKSVFDEVLILFNTSIKSKPLNISTLIDADLVLHTDPEALKIILRNIISNAIKFSIPNGDISVSTEKKGGFIQICITDSGNGDVKELKNILNNADEFKSTPGTMNERGTGIGLKLVKEFIGFLGGKIELSEADKGITFCITLPQNYSPG